MKYWFWFVVLHIVLTKLIFYAEINVILELHVQNCRNYAFCIFTGFQICQQIEHPTCPEIILLWNLGSLISDFWFEVFLFG